MNDFTYRFMAVTNESPSMDNWRWISVRSPPSNTICVSFCSNEEFNAAENVSKGVLTYTTVSEQRIKGQIEHYKQLQNVQRHSQSIYAKRDFYTELVKLCNDYGYDVHQIEDKKIKGYFIPIKEKKFSDENSYKNTIKRYFKKYICIFNGVF